MGIPCLASFPNQHQRISDTHHIPDLEVSARGPQPIHKGPVLAFEVLQFSQSMLLMPGDVGVLARHRVVVELEPPAARLPAESESAGEGHFSFLPIAPVGRKQEQKPGRPR